MGIQISPAREAEEFPNPFGVANLFHYFALAIAVGAGMLLGIEATGDGLDAPALAVAIVLILIGFLHGQRAWQDSYFAVEPEKIQLLGGSDFKASTDYLKGLIEAGIPISGKLDGAVANLLLRKAPGLRHAPEFIQVFAIRQSGSGLLALAALVSFTFAMAFTHGQPGQTFIAAAYFLVCLRLLRPMRAFQRIMRGSIATLTPELVRGARREDLVTLTFFAIGPLIGRALAGPLEQLAASLYLPSELIFVTGSLLLASVLIGVLCFVAIMAQTQELQRSKADWSIQPLPMCKADVDMVFNRLDTYLEGVIGSTSRHRMPARELNRKNPSIPPSGSGQFHGRRVLESAVESNLGPSRKNPVERVSLALADRRQRPMLLLNIVGIVLFAAGVALLCKFAGASTMWGSVSAFVTGVGFIAAAEHAFAAAHLLWQRFEFTSEFIWVEMKGGYKIEQQVLRDHLVTETGVVRTGSETTSMRPTVSGVELKISCFTVRSVCFALDGQRSAMEVTTSPASAEALARVLKDSMMEFREGQKTTLREEAELKHAYAIGQDVAPQSAIETSPQHIVREAFKPEVPSA